MRRRLALLAASLVALAAPGVASAEGPAVDARAWALVDARSGEVLVSHAGADRLPIASTTKLMTAYVAMRELPLDRIVRAAPYDAIYGESLLELRPGERVSVRDLLYGLILRSGNDAAYDLALAAAGSEARFVTAMNRYAAALGLPDTSYANPIGLDQAGNYSSALDLATLARRLLRDRAFARIADAREARLRSLRPPRTIDTLNDLLYRAPWATGVKTGHTFGAAYVLVASGERRGTKLISVVIGAPTETERDMASLRLLEYGFSLYRPRTPVVKGRSYAAPEVRYGDETLPLRAARTVAIGLRPDQRLGLAVRAPSEVEGPLRRGVRLGRVDVFVDGRPVGTAALRAGRRVDEASVLTRFAAFLGDEKIPVAIALCVILLGAVLLRRFAR